jgi:hypothetical protein
LIVTSYFSVTVTVTFYIQGGSDISGTLSKLHCYGKINKSIVYYVERKFEKFIASGGSADTVLTGRKGTVLAANLDEHIIRDLGRSLHPPPPPSAGEEHFQNNYGRIVSKDALT